MAKTPSTPLKAARRLSGSSRSAATTSAPSSVRAHAASESVRRVNEILDEKIRPYLASDGGWLEVLSLDDKKLTIHYQGACGSCPSSLSGTLMAIERLMQEEIDPEIEVVAV